MGIMVIYDMIHETIMHNCVRKTTEDHLIILCEFPMSNKACIMSSSIQVPVNCSRVQVNNLQVNNLQVSVKLHLSCTVAIV